MPLFQSTFGVLVFTISGWDEALQVNTDLVLTDQTLMQKKEEDRLHPKDFRCNGWNILKGVLFPPKEAMFDHDGV